MYSVPRGEGGQPPEIQLADPQQDLLRAGRGQGLHPTEDEAPNRLHKVSCVTLLLINRTNTSENVQFLVYFWKESFFEVFHFSFLTWAFILYSDNLSFCNL